MRAPSDAGGGPTALLRRFDHNCYIAVGFVVLGVALLLLIPTQIEKPLLLLGQASGGLDPTLFPSLVAAALIVLGLWFLAVALATTEPNALRELGREEY